MFKSLFSLLGILIFTNVYSQNSSYSIFRTDFRADSIEIKHVDLSVSISNLASQQIQSKAILTMAPKVNNLTSMEFDLMGYFTVDSIKQGNTSVYFTHNNSTNKLRLFFTPALNTIDTIAFSIFYKGSPSPSSGGFGGFYWSGNYAFNLGVSMDDLPHSAGRFWFPCIDDFNARSTYSYHIEVSPSHRASAGGVLDSVTTLPNNNKVFHFQHNNPIPPYLVSINVAPNTVINKSYTSIYGSTIPIKIYATPADSAGASISLSRIDQMAHVFEQWFGPYIWPQIGYSLVPFNSGAMEHSCNIAFPRGMATGSMQYEYLAAHELAHSWWGNNTTCETSQEMWLNEGFASFCEYVYSENLVSNQNELATYLSNLNNVLDNAHIDDGGYHPLSGVPTTATYGTHTYVKGSLVIRSLMNYLGKSTFINATKAVQQQRRLQSINTEQFFQIMSQASGVNLTNFKNDWILQPGFATVTLDSFEYKNGKVHFAVTQKYRAVNHPYAQTKFVATFVGANRQRVSHSFSQGSLQETHQIQIGFEPKAILLNADNAYAYASMGAEKEIKTNGSHSLPHTRSILKVANMNGMDSLYARVDYHRVAPEQNHILNNQFIISPGRYWTLQLIGDTNIKPTFLINIDGSPTGYDAGIIHHKDAIRILYRKNAQFDWTIWPNDSILIFSNGNLKGSIEALNAKSGDYAVGSIRKDVSVPSITKFENIKVYPNPSSGTFSWDSKFEFTELYIYNMDGKLIQTQALSGNTITLQKLASGVYTGIFYDKKHKNYTTQLIIQ